MAPERLFLIDGSSLVYRSYYALLRGGRSAEGRPAGLATRAGLPTGAVYGFLITLRKLLGEHGPDYVGIAFDHRVPTFRHEAYADYKAHRKPMPDDLQLQLPYVRRAVEAMRIPVLIEERYEADDILGTLARKAVEAGLEVVLVTGDKDMYQLLGPRVSMLQVRTETRLVRAEDVEREFGVRPDQVADVLALWGDPTDNIPGIKGFGEKGAKSLIAAHGSLDGVYAHLDRLKPAQAARLREAQADARLSRELATIRTDLALELDLERLRLGEPDRAALHELCRELEFRALAEEFAPTIEAGRTRLELHRDESGLESVAAAARAGRRVAIEILLGDAGPMAAPLVGMALAWRPGEGAYVPLGHAHGSGSLPPERALALLRPLLEDETVAKLGSDLKRARVALERQGVRLAGLAHDVSVLSYLLDPGRASHDLEAVARDRLGRATIPYASLTGKGRGQLKPSAFPVERAAEYAAERADLALELGPRLAAEVEAKGLGALYHEVELPLIEVLADMETAGVRVDVPFLERMSGELDRELEGLTRRIHALAGSEFNVNSPRQLGEVLFEKMRLPVLKKTRKARAASTDTDVLEELALSYELPRLVLEQRELAKLKGTYVDALPALVNPATGRVHCRYNQAVAATGRLSSSDPNLQNIPIRTEVGRRIRRAFVAAEGSLLVVADYSQIELRLLAHLSGDAELAAAFRDGADVHQRTAATMFGIHEGLVTPELRRRAKVINFGIVYGMSAYGLSRELGVAPSEAGKLIDAYFARYSGVRAWLDRTIAGARAQGHVTTLLGRIRYIPEITSPNRTVREYAERTAVNTPIQGTAADLIKLAMVRIARRLAAAGSRARLTLQVHDELQLEAPAAEAPQVAEVVREEMEGVHKLDVPLVVSVGTGRDWLEAK